MIFLTRDKFLTTHRKLTAGSLTLTTQSLLLFLGIYMNSFFKSHILFFQHMFVRNQFVSARNRKYINSTNYRSKIWCKGGSSSKVFNIMVLLCESFQLSNW